MNANRGGPRALALLIAPLRFLRRVLSPRRHLATLRWLRREARDLRRRRREPRLTVAVDISCFFEPLTGVGWYLHELLRHLADRDDLRLRLYGQSTVEAPGSLVPVVAPPSGPAIEWVRHRLPADSAPLPSLAARLLVRLAPFLLAADANRVLFAPNYLFSPVFRRARGARVAMVHDLAILRLPGTVRPDAARALTGRLRATAAGARLLLTPSRAVRDEVVELLGVPPERVRAVHHGPGHWHAAPPQPPPADLPPRYVLHVGTLEPRKNLPVLLAAWRLLRRRMPDAPALVLCGGYGWKADELRAQVEAARREGWAHPLGYVAAGALAALYRGAAAVVLPSLYEGFGLPAVEALAAGAPLVASDLPVLREVAGEAALYVPPDEPEAWAAQLERLLGDGALRAELRRLGGERARAFDWGRAAEETAAAWREASLPAVAGR